jgi:1-acyl-sn-glycerol-3-phosphate acyltransferase
MRSFLRFIIRALLGLITDIEFHGKENLPESGGIIVAANHLGFLDVFMIFYVFDHWDMFVMMAEKWKRHAWMRWISKYLNFVFIDRYKPDLPAMREVMSRLNNGQVLIIAPEGTRSHNTGLNEAKPGASYLAAKLGQPILPAAVFGTEDEKVLDNLRHFRKSHITLVGGVPFRLPPLPAKNRDEALKHASDEIMCRIAALLPESYRGVYAEHPRLKELLKSSATKN